MRSRDGLLPGWDGSTRPSRWLLRINLIALTPRSSLLAAAYVLGFRHTAVEIDLGGHGGVARA